MHRRPPALLLGALVFLVACSPIAAPSPQPSQSAAVEPIEPTNAPGGGELVGDNSLRLWLPPVYSPDLESPAAVLFSERLSQYQAAHPQLELDVRVKAESGAAGLIESLRAASVAAPDTMPDVIALDPVGLHTAALKGLIQPYPADTSAPTDESWFPFAVQAAHVDGVFYGLPFASDALILAYRASAFEAAPVSWNSLIGADRPVLLPAADPTAQFTLAQYLAQGGALFGPNGRPSLDPAVLSTVLEFYASAREAGVLIASASRTETVEASWTGLRERRVDAAAASYQLLAADDSVRFATGVPLPTRDGQGISFARTWSWALVSSDPEAQAAALDLIDWLNRPDFVGPWTESLALLPPTPAALEAWAEGGRATLAALLMTSLQLQPTEEIVATFGPPLRVAVDSVLSGAATPDAAAFQAAQAVQSP